MDTLLNDLRFALRTLRRTPAFTIAAVLCLALGIGANSAIFSVVDAVLLRPLPFPQPERLVTIWETNASHGGHRGVVSPADYRDWKAQNGVFSDIAVFTDRRTNLTALETPEQVPIEYATASLFPTLGVRPVLGRVFDEREDLPNAEPVVVLGFALWQRLYAGSPNVIGQRLVMNGTPATIVGVMPREFGASGIAPGTASTRQAPQLFAPLGLDPARDYRRGSGRFLLSVARLKPNVTLARAEREMDAIAARLAQTYPDFNGGWGVGLVPLRDQIVGGARKALLVLAGVVGFVLLIACANVANLQLARAAARRREIGVRAALGAARGRVVRQLLTESVLLALIGAAVGLLLAYWGVEALRALAATSLPRVEEIRLDGAVIGFTLLLAVLTGIVFGLVPALQAARADVYEVLKEGARGATRTGSARGMLVGAQVALSMVLLVGAGLLIRSFARLQSETPGFNPEHVLTARIALPLRKYDTQAKVNAFYADLLDRTRRLAGVREASAIDWLPFGGLGSATDYWVEGRPIPKTEDHLGADIQGVDANYFRTMQIPLVRGELFTERDGPDAPKKVVINETLARAVFPGQNPVGQRIAMPWGDTLRAEVVAVVGDTKSAGLDSLPKPVLYWAMDQFATTTSKSLVIRTTGDPMAVATALRGVVHAIDPEQPLADVKPIDEYLSQSVAQRRFSMALLAGFAGIALVLAAVGIYGVLAYAVAQRTREIGVRMALGAREADVLRMVVREGLVVTGAGLAVGILGALALTRVLGSLLYDTSTTDPLTFVAVALALGAVAMFASWLPARRAARVDPVVALREE
jgi:putative ABC transport system permease protein